MAPSASVTSFATMSLLVGSGPSVMIAAVRPSGEIAGSRMKYDQVFVPFFSRPVSRTSGVPDPSALIRSRLGTERL